MVFSGKNSIAARETTHGSVRWLTHMASNKDVMFLKKDNGWAMGCR